jgi:hypothetical protein
MRRIIFQTRKCLKNGATRGHVPRESELKKAMNGLFQHPARGQRKKVPPAAAAQNPTSGGKTLNRLLERCRETSHTFQTRKCLKSGAE